MRVSVLINNYNYGKYLSSAIESVLNCQDENLEIIVYDDGSTDNSLDVLKMYEDQVKYISEENYKHSPNQNQANAIYQAFLQSKGDIIFLLDSDDMFESSKINKVKEVFARYQDVTTVQNLMLEMDFENHLTDIVRPVIKQVTDIKLHIYEKNSLFHLFVPTSGLAFRRSFLEKVLPLKEDSFIFVWPDARLCLQSVFYGQIYTIMEPLTYYRIHGTNDSNTRGTLEGHSQYLEQIYSYFNGLALANNHPMLEYSAESYLEGTYFYTNLNREKIDQFVYNNKQVYIWGAGEAGQSIYYYLKNKEADIVGFIDINLKRKDERIMGLTVIPPKFEKNLKFIVSPIHAFSNIKFELEKVGFRENIDFIYPYRG